MASPPQSFFAVIRNDGTVAMTSTDEVEVMSFVPGIDGATIYLYSTDETGNYTRVIHKEYRSFDAVERVWTEGRS